jgi:hypothetical protein
VHILHVKLDDAVTFLGRIASWSNSVLAGVFFVIRKRTVRLLFSFLSSTFGQHFFHKPFDLSSRDVLRVEVVSMQLEELVRQDLCIHAEEVLKHYFVEKRLRLGLTSNVV